jgi:RNA polymerase sigma-70 factor (ECF subfamily)
MDEKALIQKLKRGDIPAIRSMVEDHKNLIWHIIISMTGKNSDSEDLFQEVFLRVFKSLNSFRSDAKLSTWMGSITHHVCVDYLRKKKRVAQEISETDLLSLHHVASDWKNDEHSDINRLLLSAIAKLPADYRTVIVLYHLDEHPYKEIAEITGMPEGTVKSYISRARQQLREMLTAVVPDMAEIINE